MGLTETAATGLALGVGANVLYAVGKHGKTKAKQALLWLIRREQNRDTVERTLAAFDADAATLDCDWQSDDYRRQVDDKAAEWSRRLASHLMAHHDAENDFTAFEQHGMETAMDFTQVTVGGNMSVATASGTGAFGNVVGDGTTINQYIAN